MAVCKEFADYAAGAWLEKSEKQNKIYTNKAYGSETLCP